MQQLGLTFCSVEWVMAGSSTSSCSGLRRGVQSSWLQRQDQQLQEEEVEPQRARKEREEKRRGRRGRWQLQQ